ncbi:MotA/TolQ/ExbB proton channel family protein [Pseudemcibacter aquimaris]|uniref:MotA/TolQ/ExbB proton channel family protein n=1 Tax=Pseudemcibacter aquimaris TaxID=2857064 RepID=UPI002012263B|nr:MotA/TolQ/ExbB proton channel family protein [Pseudemcibacter aquimaris]MCC3860040.1 MotA/TolQ/ExbB proton channel family protein [Pseudemcibacter aquimaris]WDU57370.1 MotA/TolQ/ExbB proton channel family protein [Pseudemcibacter aquimaris]
MIKPQKYLNRTIIFLIGVIIVCAVLFPTMQSAFTANPGLNGLIALVLVAGIVISMRQTITLIPAVGWLETFKKADSSEVPPEAPALLGAMATMMNEQRSKKLSLSTASMNTILDGVAARMDEGREITRYIIGLLIFLGLLGTFWGLLGTIGSIGDTINSLQVGTDDISLMFEDLKEGLAAPLAGMGTAFSSSLFGLAGSVILGFIDLQTGQAQGRFFNHLEDWLSGITKLSSAGSNIALEAGDASVPAYVSALLEESADSLDNLHKVISKSEENRAEVNKAITNLSIQLSSLVDHQTEMRSVMKQMVTFLGALKDGGDEVSQNHLRNIDVQLKTLTDETIKSQDKFADNLHSEIRVLARTISAAMDGSAKVAAPAPSAALAQPAPEPKEPVKTVSAEETDYEMPEIKPKGNKKPALTAKRED